MGRKDLSDCGVTVQTLLAHLVKLPLEDPDPPQPWLYLPCPLPAPLLPLGCPLAMPQSLLEQGVPAAARVGHKERPQPGRPGQGKVWSYVLQPSQGSGACTKRCTVHHLLLASEARCHSTVTLQNAKLPFQPGTPEQQLLRKHRSAPGWSMLGAARTAAKPKLKHKSPQSMCKVRHITISRLSQI